MFRAPAQISSCAPHQTRSKVNRTIQNASALTCVAVSAGSGAAIPVAAGGVASNTAPQGSHPTATRLSRYSCTACTDHCALCAHTATTHCTEPNRRGTAAARCAQSGVRPRPTQCGLPAQSSTEPSCRPASRGWPAPLLSVDTGGRAGSVPLARGGAGAPADRPEPGEACL